MKAQRVEIIFVAIFRWVFLKRKENFTYRIWQFSAICIWSLSQRLDSICYYLEEILVNFIPVFSVRFASLFVYSVFYAIFFSSSFLLQVQYFFSICYMFYLHFWGTSFSKQRSVNVGERDVGSVSSTHCSNVLFAEFEQVIACCGSITLDYLRFLLFFEWFWLCLCSFQFY